MNAQFCTDIVSDRKRTVFRRGALVRPVTIIDVLDRAKGSEGVTRRQFYKRMWRNRFYMFPMFFSSGCYT